MAITDNLIAYYRLDESDRSAGQTLADSHSTFHMTVQNGVLDLYASGVSNSLGFVKGASEWAACSDPSEARPDLGGAITIRIPFAPQSGVGSQPVVSRWDDALGSSGQEWVMLWDAPNTRPQLLYRDATESNNSIFGPIGSMVQGAQHDVVFRHDPVTNFLSMVVDGDHASGLVSQTFSTGLFDSTAGARLALATWYSGGGRVYGDQVVDELAIWDRVLTDEEVSSVYSAWQNREPLLSVADGGDPLAGASGEGVGGRAYYPGALGRLLRRYF